MRTTRRHQAPSGSTETAGAERTENKAKQARDQITGLTADKRQARDALRSQVPDAEREFIKSVAEVQGWEPGDLTQKLPANLTEEARAKADKSHHRELLKKATRAVGLQRQALLLDAGLRAAAFSGGVPLTRASDAPVSVEETRPDELPGCVLGIALRVRRN